MTAGHRLRVRGLACVAGLVVLSGLAGCGNDPGAPTAGREGGAGDASSTAQNSEPSPSPTPDISVAETIIDIVVTNGVPTPATGQVAVPLGNTVRLFITADAADEVHVHGYDLTADIAPGGPVELTFVADIPGSFAVEFHEGGQLLCELRVE